MIEIKIRFNLCLLPFGPTPWSRVILEKLAGPYLVKKFPVFYGNQSVIAIFMVVPCIDDLKFFISPTDAHKLY
jgi:hypothetical protein